MNGFAENKRLKKSIKKLTKQNHIINLLKKTEGALIAQKIAEKLTDVSDDHAMTHIERIKRRKTDDMPQPEDEQAPITYTPKDLNKK